jgi:hypothetical protein
MPLLSRSTHRRAREAYHAARRLQSHLIRQLRYGGELRRHCAGKTGLLLNIGCGPLIREGWVNIDYQHRAGQSFYFDALDHLPIASAAVRHIHCEHFLEHLEYADALEFLKECARLLEAGGTMRLIVPDAERYMRAYCADEQPFFAQLAHLGNTLEPLTPKNRVCNHSFRMDGEHRFGWDFETLEAACRPLGFTNIARSTLNDIEGPYRLDGQDWWRPLESLYANLRKRA